MSEKVTKTPILGGINAIEQELKAMGLSGDNFNTYLADVAPLGIAKNCHKEEETYLNSKNEVCTRWRIVCEGAPEPGSWRDNNDCN